MKRCRCHEEFEARHFRSVAEADEFLMQARISGLFLPLNDGKTRLGCRCCGESWEIFSPPQLYPEWRRVPPWPPPLPLAVVHRERLRLRKSGELQVSYPGEAEGEVEAVLRAIASRTSPLEKSVRDGELSEIRVLIGARLKPASSLEPVFRKRWEREAMDPAWWGHHAGHHDRPVEIEGILKLRRRLRFGFAGELHVLVVDTQHATVRAAHEERLPG